MVFRTGLSWSEVCLKVLGWDHWYFLLLIDDLQLDCLVHKFVDDTTLSELLEHGYHASNMTQYVESLSTWAQTNKMIVNRSKSKEMIFGSLAKQSVPCLTVQSDVIKRVTSFHFSLKTFQFFSLCARLNWQFICQFLSANSVSYCIVSVSYTHLTLPTNREV